MPHLNPRSKKNLKDHLHHHHSNSLHDRISPVKNSNHQVIKISNNSNSARWLKWSQTLMPSFASSKWTMRSIGPKWKIVTRFSRLRSARQASRPPASRLQASSSTSLNIWCSHHRQLSWILLQVLQFQPLLQPHRSKWPQPHLSIKVKWWFRHSWHSRTVMFTAVMTMKVAMAGSSSLLSNRMAVVQIQEKI